MLKGTGNFNPIGFLNEFCQKNKLCPPIYSMKNKTGPDHSPTFYVDCIFRNKIFSGQGSSIKEAKENVTFQIIAFEQIKDQVSFKIVDITPYPDNNIASLWNNTCQTVKVTIRKKEEETEEFKTLLFQISQTTNND